MRNLKKILALVLALVMSLSLMATASAADTTAETGSKYQTAAEVLNKVGVVKGDAGTNDLRLTDSITRAEVAALLYRIATGDVDDKEATNYSGKFFTDVLPGDWYTSYVDYCYIGEIIKGNPNGSFEPNDKINGYATLAMILRAMGYGKNGEFVGDGWEIRTASIAKQIGVLDGIADAQLSGPAARELVFEILFRAIFKDMVKFTALYPNNYEPQGKNLAKENLNLERIEGVVVANEFADLTSDQVLDQGKTKLKTADETRTLAYTTRITDIGESRYAYVQNGSTVVSMGDTGKNTVKDTEGKACDISTPAKFKSVAEMPAASDIEYYVNFEPWTRGGYECDQRLEFSVVFYGSNAERAFDNYRDIDISVIAARDSEYSVEVQVEVDGEYKWVTLDTNTSVDYKNASGTAVDKAGNPITVNYGYSVRYTKIIWANEIITDTDLTVLESIFGTADNENNNVIAANKITGDVFVGTKSTNTATDEERDLSNSISYKKFFADYIEDNSKNINWGESFNGDWVKFIDNDNDGEAEYAFYTRSFLDEAVHTYTNRNGDTVTEFITFDDNTYNVPNGRYTVRYLDNDGNDTTEVPAVGDKVIAAYIDHQILVEPALDETVTVSSYSWREDEITTDKGVYGQSGIYNNTDMMEQIDTMEDKVEYIVYFDHFGFVRAYELPGGTTYALLTELYYTNMQQGNIKQNWPMTVEATIPDEEGNGVTKEYNVVSGDDVFSANTPWMLVDNLASTSNYNNWLQPAISHLGVSRDGWKPAKGTPTFGGGNSLFWPANRQIIKNITAWDATGDEFNYGTQTYGNTTLNTNGSVDWSVAQNNGTASFTNVAIVNVNGDDISLAGAAKLSLNQISAAPTGYAVEYIQLDRSVDVVEDAVRYPIGGDPTYVSVNNQYVNATHETKYFIAYNGGVKYFEDYVNMPALTNADNRIHAAYAVAKNTNSDDTGAPYWVAEVIVYEVYDLDDTAQSSVSLAYYTPTRLSGTVQQIETLNSKYGPMVTLTPGGKNWNATSGQWGVGWDSYGFYALNNDTEPVDNVMTARSISRINIDDYAKNCIYAGTVTREAYIAGAGWYIDVDMGNGNIASIEITDKIYGISRDFDQSDDWYEYSEATLLRYQDKNNSQVRAGDKVIWINTDAVKAAPAASTATLNATKFVVDLGNENWYSKVYAGAERLLDTPAWLISINRDIWDNPVYDAQGKPVVSNPAGTKAAASTQGEWQRIMWEQTKYTDPSTLTTIEFDLALTGSDNIQFFFEGNPVSDVLTSADKSVKLSVPGKNRDLVQLTLTGSAKIAAIVPSGSWITSTVTPTAGGYTVVLYDNAQLKSASDEAGTIYSVATVNAMIADANKTVAQLSLERVEEIQAALPAIKEAREAAGASVKYATLEGLDEAVTKAEALDAAEALESAQTTAKGEVTEYEKAAVAKLTGANKEAVDTAKTAADKAIDKATTSAEIETAVKAYKDAVNKALAAADSTLETKRAEALTTVANYKADEVKALTGTFAETAATAKTTADTAIKAAASAESIAAAVATYKTAVNDAISGAAEDAEQKAEEEAEKALVALKIEAKEAIEVPEAVAEDSTVVSARQALEYAIDNASATTITNYYANGKLVDTNKLVKALNDAIDDALATAAGEAAAKKALDDAKTAAIGVVEAAIDAVTGAAADDAVKAAKTTLVGKINDCTAIAGEGSATTTDVEFYVKAGKLVSGTEVNALTAAILAVEKANTVKAAAAYLADQKALLTTDELESLNVSEAQSTFDGAVANPADSAALTTALNNYKTAVAAAVQAIVDARE